MTTLALDRVFKTLDGVCLRFESGGRIPDGLCLTENDALRLRDDLNELFPPDINLLRDAARDAREDEEYNCGC